MPKRNISRIGISGITWEGKMRSFFRMQTLSFTPCNMSEFDVNMVWTRMVSQMSTQGLKPEV